MGGMKGLDHVAFRVAELDAAVGFYVEKLGCRVLSRQRNEAEQEEFCFLELGELKIELLQALDEPGHRNPEARAPYCPHVAIKTDDLKATVARLTGAGVTLLRGPLEIAGEVTWAYFKDLDNNVLEFVQWFRKDSMA